MTAFANVAKSNLRKGRDTAVALGKVAKSASVEAAKAAQSPPSSRAPSR